MGLDAVVRAGVATAKSVTSDLRDQVTLEAWTGNDGYGKPTYATSIGVDALVEYKQRKVRNAQGDEVLSRAKVTILEDLPANGTSGRREPIDPRDRLTLQDGTTGEILDVEGLVDPSTGEPYLIEVWMG